VVATGGNQRQPGDRKTRSNKPKPLCWVAAGCWSERGATADQAINPDVERFMAKRAGAETIEIDGSHAVMVVEPRAVAQQIRAALRRVSAAVAA
jgi:hypothetical protein